MTLTLYRERRLPWTMGAGCTRCVLAHSPSETEVRAAIREEVHHLRVGLRLQEKKQRERRAADAGNVLDGIVRAASSSTSCGGLNEVVLEAPLRVQSGTNQREHAAVATRGCTPPRQQSDGHTRQPVDGQTKQRDEAGPSIAGASIPSNAMKRGPPPRLAAREPHAGPVRERSRVPVRSRASLKAPHDDPPRVEPEATAISVPASQDPSPSQSRKEDRASVHPPLSLNSSCSTFGLVKPSALWQRRYGQSSGHPSFLKVPYVPKDAPR
jgi:hypothetical protein